MFPNGSPAGTAALALAWFAFASAGFAGDKKQRDWCPATVVQVSKDSEGAKASATKVISQADDTVNLRLQYTLDTAEAIYVLKVFNPTPPGSSTRLPPRPAPKVKAGDQVEIAVKKNDAWLLDSAGKEHLRM